VWPCCAAVADESTIVRALLVGLWRDRVARGAGMELVQGTDIRVASTAARFGLMEPARGLFPMGGSTVRLPRQVCGASSEWVYAWRCDVGLLRRLWQVESACTWGLLDCARCLRLPRLSVVTTQIPKAIAMEILLTGKLMSAERMHAVGFVNHVAAPAQLMEVATSLANTIAANSPGALVAIKKSVRLCSGIALEQSMSVELAVGGPVFQQPDAVEGPRAFAEKRQPVWQPVGSGPEHSRSKL